MRTYYHTHDRSQEVLHWSARSEGWIQVRLFVADRAGLIAQLAAEVFTGPY
jgi:hypothetical protein